MNDLFVLQKDWLVDGETDQATVECGACHRKFAAPDASKITEAICEDCLAAQNINSMKNDDSEAKSAIDAALGM